jgi:hypothetical protein
MAERILKIGRECAAHFKEPYKSIDHGELLYDEEACQNDQQPSDPSRLLKGGSIPYSTVTDFARFLG